MEIEKWPGTRVFSPKFKIEHAGVAKHNKAQTYFGGGLYNLFVPEN